MIKKYTKFEPLSKYEIQILDHHWKGSIDCNVFRLRVVTNEPAKDENPEPIFYRNPETWFLNMERHNQRIHFLSSNRADQCVEGTSKDRRCDDLHTFPAARNLYAQLSPQTENWGRLHSTSRY